MKTAVVSFYNQAFQPVVDITEPAVQEYCVMHGYSRILHSTRLSDREPINWDVIPTALDALRSFDLVLALDCDCLVTNPEIRLESIVGFNAAVAATKDFLQLNAGVLLIKNTAQAWVLLGAAWGLPEFHPAHCRNDGTSSYNSEIGVQRALAFCFRAFAHCVTWVPQRAMNSYPERPDIPLSEAQKWRPGDFIAHVPGMPVAGKVALLKQCVARA